MYDIKVLSNHEFDNLSYEATLGSDVSGSAGFINPRTNTAYVRYSIFPELNKYLINHEFDHLVEDEATDEDENGIRHKLFSSFFKNKAGSLKDTISKFKSISGNIKSQFPSRVPSQAPSQIPSQIPSRVPSQNKPAPFAYRDGSPINSFQYYHPFGFNSRVPYVPYAKGAPSSLHYFHPSSFSFQPPAGAQNV